MTRMAREPQERGVGDNILATDDRLRLLVERYERLDEEQKGIGEDKKDVVAEVAAVGYDKKIFREIIKVRKMTPDDRRNHYTMLDSYAASLGLDLLR